MREHLAALPFLRPSGSITRRKLLALLRQGCSGGLPGAGPILTSRRILTSLPHETSSRESRRAGKRESRMRRQPLAAALALFALAVATPALAQPRGFTGSRDSKAGSWSPATSTRGSPWRWSGPRGRQAVGTSSSSAPMPWRTAGVTAPGSSWWISKRTPEAVRAFLEGKRTRAPVYLDEGGAFSKRFAVTHLPGLLLIFQDGQNRFSGRLSRDPDTLIAQSLQ